MPSAALVNRHLGIDLPCPTIDSSAQRLHLLESLLPQPGGHIHRPHTVVANDNDMILRIEFLIETRRNIAHGDVFAAFQFGGFNLPWFAHVQYHNVRLYFSSDFSSSGAIS